VEALTYPPRYANKYNILLNLQDFSWRENSIGRGFMDQDMEKRSEPRSKPEQYYSVEISISGIVCSYQFKIWNRSSTGLCIVVKEGSELLKHLKVGDVFDMKYYAVDATRPAEYLKTEVRHITRDDEGPFKGHYYVGISILES
jgi:hypothetical protein